MFDPGASAEEEPDAWQQLFSCSLLAVVIALWLLAGPK